VGGAFQVALTFDAEHPDRAHRPGVTEAILDVLADHGVASTWFLQGRWVEAHPETASRVARDGHLVGSHSFYHARLPLLTDDGIAADVRAAERAIRDIVGVDPRPWFRCPFSAGSDDPRVLGLLSSMGYRDVEQDIVLEDWEPNRTGEAIAEDAVREVPLAGDPVVILLHAWPPGMLVAMPAMIDGLRALGAAFVRIDDLERFAGQPASAFGRAPAPARAAADA